MFDLRATPFVWREPRSLPRQQWVYGYELQRGLLSALIAPGAAGKSTYLMARALCMVTGNGRFRQRVWNGPHRVWLWNLEDKRIHLERMLHAFCLHFGVREEDIADRLFMDSAVRNGPGEGEYDSQILKLATEEKGEGFKIQRPVVDALIRELRARGIDHLDVDPFVSSHSVSENDNGAIDAVSKEWAHVAAETNCSISLAHHVRKFEGREATAFDARGAVAMINAARSVLVINPMDAQAADSCGLKQSERTHYFRIIDGKNNRAPATLQGDWFKKVGIGLGNGDDSGPEDNIATVERYLPPNIWGGLKASQLIYIQDRVEEAGPARCRSSSLSPSWVGFMIADILDEPVSRGTNGAVAPGPGKEKIVAFLKAWIDSGVFRVEEHRVSNSEMKPCLVVGERVDPATV